MHGPGSSSGRAVGKDPVIIMGSSCTCVEALPLKLFLKISIVNQKWILLVACAEFVCN